MPQVLKEKYAGMKVVRDQQDNDWNDSRAWQRLCKDLLLNAPQRCYCALSWVAAVRQTCEG
ncbi:hypothetical protein METHPM2_450017 [Pseudomonas sp. PM2]